MDLYPEAARPTLDPVLFSDPPSRYRGTPFWSWNTRMEPAHLEMIGEFKQMGMGGVHIHARTGLATPYLGDEFMALAKASADECERQGMLLWLYDEDRWPSGYAGGLVTRDDATHRQQILAFTRIREEDYVPPKHEVAHVELRRTGALALLARFALVRSGSALVSWRRLAGSEACPAGAEEWFAYAGATATSRWFNRGTYLDTLSPKAVEAFIASTHERYRAVLGDRFGTTIPAIFSDEPQMAAQFAIPARGDDGADRLLPWTGDLPAAWRAAHGTDLLDELPAVVFDRVDGAHAAPRWRWHDLLAGRFAEAYAGTIGRWCGQHGIAMTGHLMCEDSLVQQTKWVGEAMRSYPHMQIPGIDMLCDEVEGCFTTAKQVQSVVRQQGGKAMLSELYGVTGWHFDFQGHKRQGDWQAALGVTVRVHHLSWVSTAGEAKRDYPAPIDSHSPWWREYRVVEDHFSRLNTVLTRGTAACRIAVIHPIESTWLDMGPGDGSGARLGGHDGRFFELNRWLINGLLDFDYVSEALLPSQGATARDGRLVVGAVAYDVVILPALVTVRRSTLALLAQLREAGVRVVVLGSAPTLVEGVPEPAAAWLAALPTVAWQQDAIFTALADVRDVRCATTAGATLTQLVSQLRQDGADRWLFVCTTERDRSQGDCVLAARGRFDVERWDTATGIQVQVPSRVVAGWTEWSWTCEAAGHELVRLSPRRAADAGTLTVPASWALAQALAGSAAVTFDEPNVLVLDRAEWRLGEGAWEPAAEVLRIDNLTRARSGLEPVWGDISQPWCEPVAPVVATVQLRFTITSEVVQRGVKLAVEGLTDTTITLDGRLVPAVADGWWVDRTIATVPLGELAVGVHQLVLSQPVSAAHTREWAYLLGTFGVRLEAERTRAVLTAPPTQLTPGDWAEQGLPFYAGNATLTWEVTVPASGDYAVDLPGLRAPLASVAVDGRVVGPVAFAPRRCDLGELTAGAHRLAVTVFGHRANAFGPLHLKDLSYRWLGPNSYRTDGAQWSDAWCLRPWGLTKAPRLLRPGGPGIAAFDEQVRGLLTTWQVSRVQPVALSTMVPPTLRDQVGWHATPPGSNFINCHGEWNGTSGVAVLVHALVGNDDGTGTLLFGYDGPVRVFLDGVEVFADPNGTNPAVVDARRIPLRLPLGDHVLTVAMDTNDGKAWGIYARLA